MDANVHKDSRNKSAGKTETNGNYSERRKKTYDTVDSKAIIGRKNVTVTEYAKKAAHTGKNVTVPEYTKKTVDTGKNSGISKASETDVKKVWRPGNMLYPVPAVMVSCGRPGEKPNIITVAWTGTVCSDPVMVSVSIRKERYSYGIIMDTGEFVINLTTEKLCRATDFCGVKSGRDVDKFSEMKLTPAKASVVTCPVIAESPVNLECRVTQTLDLGSHTMFLAEVVAVDVSSRYIDEKDRLDLNSTGLMTYSHGEYFGLGRKIGSFGYSVKKR